MGNRIRGQDVSQKIFAERKYEIVKAREELLWHTMWSEYISNAQWAHPATYIPAANHFLQSSKRSPPLPSNHNGSYKRLRQTTTALTM